MPLVLQDIAYKAAYKLHLEPNHKYLQEVLDTWNGRKPDDSELEEAIQYLQLTKGWTVFPDKYMEKYMKSYVKAKESEGFPYILFEGKKLFFPRSYGKSWASGYYRFLEMELDAKSPHCYFSEAFPIPSQNEVLFDVGAAEAVISLRYVEKVKHVFIFECDPAWMEALYKTFEPYKDKVTIINKFVSDNNENNCITLDAFVQEYYGEMGLYEHFVVKLDVEGAEASVLKGSEKLLDSRQSRFAVCTYHKPDDAEKFQNMFRGRSYNTELSPKYMLFGGGIFGKPSLRKGVLRAWCDNGSQYKEHNFGEKD